MKFIHSVSISLGRRSTRRPLTHPHAPMSLRGVLPGPLAPPRNYSLDRLRFTDLSAESVALTGYRLDELWRTPVVTKLHAKLANVAINDIALDLELAAPDAREQLLAAQDFPRVGCEQVQEGLLDRRERKILATDPDALLDQIDLEGAEADLRDQRDAHVVGAAHEREWPGDDLIERERHLDDVVRATLERAQLHGRVAFSRERKDRDVPMGQATAEQVDEPLVEVEIDQREVGVPVADHVAAFVQ